MALFEDRPFDDIHTSVGGQRPHVGIEDAPTGRLEERLPNDSTAREGYDIGSHRFERCDRLLIVVILGAVERDPVLARKLRERWVGDSSSRGKIVKTLLASSTVIRRSSLRSRARLRTRRQMMPASSIPSSC